ncbi:aminotransferase class I/II-fold pyridoxal phosphate-dependent enzyme [Auritidibacter ignavus]|uniref:aminotransferase class I/II-fold pyridoxal phosphate-dependent enzyme n=1 Tax=Auritidibacter ignavus TaxID=678932 RepID=UPI002449E2AF|nr:aminotransferase class I/II-fold pyridoxal phosphate-dependent enzyme [Auritidibacter ignavus]WGH84115.1 aminotransferase class I/II-fold pyridoxal phosphate-dependent enzyme [Auritidibacter ignavus]
MDNAQDPAVIPQSSVTEFPPGPWQAVATGAGLLTDGVPAPTIFEEMTTAAREYEAVNLGQGFPDQDGPEFIRARAGEIIAAGGATYPGANQYAAGTGFESLRQALANYYRRSTEVEWDPASNILVTTGATEALAASILALVSPGDEVITFEPSYDSYGAIIGLAGARDVPVPLHAPDFQPSPEALKQAITDATRMVILNTPHKPSGRSVDADTLAQIVAICARHNVWLLSDEVYETLMYTGEHRSAAIYAHGAQGYSKIITVSSAGKMLSLTGWKVGWLLADAPVVSAIRAVKQFLTYSSGPAYQMAVAEALDAPERLDPFLASQRAEFGAQRDRLVTALRSAGLDPVVPDAGYFVVVDLAPLGVTDAATAARELVKDPGIAGIPVSSFCSTDNALKQFGSWMRLAFCKSPTVMDQALQRLERLPGGR